MTLARTPYARLSPADIGQVDRELKKLEQTSAGLYVPKVLVHARSPYAVLATDTMLLCDCTAGPITLTFPLAARVDGMSVQVVKSDTSANAVTLLGTFSGVASPTLTVPDSGFTIVAMNGAYHVTAFVPYPIVTGETGVTSMVYPYSDVRRYGAVGVGDETTKIQNAITSAQTLGTNVIDFSGPSYQFTHLSITVPNFRFRGVGLTATNLMATGSGVAIELGSDNGLPYTTLLYDGVAQGFSLERLYLHYNGPTDTNFLNQTSRQYKAGTYGIRDWRSGGIKLEHARIVGFNYGFWGIQSDLNVWNDVTFESNHVGAYFGPASDQLVGTAIYSIGNDTMWQIEGCGGGKVFGWTTDSDGSPTSYPCSWGNYNDGAGHIRRAYRWDFYSPWLERIGSLPLTVAIDAWFSLGYGDTQLNDVFCIHYPMVRTNFWNTAGLERANYIVRADQLKCVQIEGPSGENGIYATNLKALVKIANGGASATVPLVRHTDCDGENINFIENYSATTVNAYIDGFQGVTYGVNVNGGTGAVSLIVSPLTSAPVLTATDHFVAGADVAGSTARIRGDTTAVGGHALDVSFASGARVLINVNATEAALVTQNAKPLYLGVSNAYKWQVPVSTGISSLFPLEALAYFVGGTSGASIRNNASSADNVFVDDSGNVKVRAGFGCNGKTAQTAVSLGAAATDLPTVIALANAIRTALIANGIGS